MKFKYKIESVLIAISGVVCTILLFKLIYSLRSILRWRVNCWFCNTNFWVKISHRNSWTCPSCEQYNGFTKDGDYNRPVVLPSDKNAKPTKVFHGSPPRNGLCKMCNINQQLKVAQLANFVAMNERNYDEEVEAYRLQLEKAYKLCSPCKRTLQTKLYREKECLLGTKLLETRSPDKKTQKQETQKQTLQNIINNTSRYLAVVILLLVSFECYRNALAHKNLTSTITSINQTIAGLFKTLVNIVRMKLYMTLPSLEVYLNDVYILYKDVSKHIDEMFQFENIDHTNVLTQEALGSFCCSIQILGHIWSINKPMQTFAIDLLWTIFIVSSVAHHYLAADQLITAFVKLTSIVAVLLVYTNMKSKTVKRLNLSPSPKRMKNLTNGSVNSLIDEDEAMQTEDDDVSLSEFGLNNLSESSSETVSPLKSSFDARPFTKSPRNRDRDIWTKPKLNSTFCVNPVLSKSPSSVSETVFVKPTFSKYQKVDNSDSDSDLDESISSLRISSPKKSKKKTTGSIFSLRKFTASPSFAVPTPLHRRPLISPSKLGHTTSWVAGGYWGSDDRQLFSVNGSRSSSQSSGFESQASSMNQRNVFSQPPSREESDCGDDRTILDRFSNCSMSGHAPHNFSRVNSPVYPQMQYNGHVHIPQARFAQQNVFTRQQYVQNTMFKSPGRSGLNMPQGSFQSR